MASARRTSAPERARDGRRYGGRSLPERRAERRARLLAAGLELFGTLGYSATTIPLLCTRAAVTARHFYEEFDSREALLKELYDEIARAVLERVRAALKNREVSGEARIRAANEAYFAELCVDERRARIYALESLGVSPEMEEHRRATRAAFVALITPPQRVVRPPLDGALLSAAVAGAAHALVLEWVMAPRRLRRDGMVDTITTLWLHTLRMEER
jgi:AcrR family transcriptional regulator